MSEPGSLIRALSGRPAARNFHSYVISEVGLGIASGRFAVGTILPNDAEMMNLYGVSRTVLREALKTLEAKGLVEARAKVGTRVLSRSRWNLFDRQVLTWVHEAGPDPALRSAFLEMRESIELQTASLAALRRSAEQLRMMQYWANQRMICAQMVEPYALAEFEFHRMLCEASQNPFLRAASPLVEFAVVQSTQPRLQAQIADFAHEKASAYVALAEAIAVGNAHGAQGAMAQILRIDRQWILPDLATGGEASGLGIPPCRL